MTAPLKIITVEDLSAILHKEPSTIRRDVSRAPERLPPKLDIPGSNKLLWLLTDVNEWIQNCSTAKPKRR